MSSASSTTIRNYRRLVARPPAPRGGSAARRFARALALAILVAVLLPVLLVLDSYRIVLDVRPLARETPHRTAVMEERLADPRTPRPLRHRPAGLVAISPHLIHGVIVHEDATFFEHHGFDGFEIRDAIRRSIEERHFVRGASTITTQLARNLYLGNDRSLLRKLREIPLTYRLERALSKRRILELYLNLVEWGPGVFGAEAASLYHFGDSANDLTPAEAALLAAALPSPRRSTPSRPSPYLRRRAAIILTRMEARGWLSPEETEVWRQELAALGGAPMPAGGWEPEPDADAGEEEGATETGAGQWTGPDNASAPGPDSMSAPASGARPDTVPGSLLPEPVLPEPFSPERPALPDGTEDDPGRMESEPGGGTIRRPDSPPEHQRR